MNVIFLASVVISTASSEMELSGTNYEKRKL